MLIAHTCVHCQQQLRGGVGHDASQATANQILNRGNSLLIGAHKRQSLLISFGYIIMLVNIILDARKKI